VLLPYRLTDRPAHFGPVRPHGGRTWAARTISGKRFWRSRLMRSDSTEVVAWQHHPAFAPHFRTEDARAVRCGTSMAGPYLGPAAATVLRNVLVLVDCCKVDAFDIANIVARWEVFKSEIPAFQPLHSCRSRYCALVSMVIIIGGRQGVPDSPSSCSMPRPTCDSSSDRN
jgi:hypothetical protein